MSSNYTRESWFPQEDDDVDRGFDFGDDAEREPSWMSKDALILMIDARSPMFEPLTSGEIPFQLAVHSSLLIFQDKIIGGSWDLIGLVIFGTERAQNSNDFPGITVLRALDQPDAPGVQQLEDLMNADVRAELGEGPVSFADALWTCSSMFAAASQKVGVKRVFLYTNDDNPVDSEAARQQATQRARDLADLGIELHLFAFPRGARHFDGDRFFRDIVNVDEDDASKTRWYDAVDKFDELRVAVRRKEFKKHALGRLLLRIDGDRDEGAGDEGIAIGVQLYNVLQETKKGTPVPLDARTNEPLKRVTKYVCEDTAAILMDYQVLSAYSYGGARVLFDKDELQKLRVLHAPGLTLLGFVDQSKVKPYWNVKHSSFIFPDERFVHGSTAAYTALTQRLLERKKVALCRLTARSNASPRLCALWPQPALMEDDGKTLRQAAGLSVLILPFAEDIRKVPVPVQPKAEESQIRAAKALVKALHIDFDSRNFPNPALQQHYANLLALATDREPEIPEDTLVFDEEGAAKRVDIIEAFAEAVGLDRSYAPDPKTTPGKKRPSTPKRSRDNEDDNARPAKRARSTSITTGDVAQYDFVALARDDKLDTLKLPELRAYCAQEGLKNISRLSKGDLIETIKKHIAKKNRT